VIYSELTRRYFDTAPLAGTLGGEGVRRGVAGSREQGAWVQFELRIEAARVTDARFLAWGCPHTIAVAAWVAEQALGAAAGPQGGPDAQMLAAHFEVPAEKLGRLLLVEDAWAALWHGY
jgi:NifU-like N terminal domain